MTSHNTHLLISIGWSDLQKKPNINNTTPSAQKPNK